MFLSVRVCVYVFERSRDFTLSISMQFNGVEVRLFDGDMNKL